MVQCRNRVTSLPQFSNKVAITNNLLCRGLRYFGRYDDISRQDVAIVSAKGILGFLNTCFGQKLGNREDLCSTCGVQEEEEHADPLGDDTGIQRFLYSG